MVLERPRCVLGIPALRHRARRPTKLTFLQRAQYAPMLCPCCNCPMWVVRRYKPLIEHQLMQSVCVDCAIP